jgi:hypothetical protein
MNPELNMSFAKMVLKGLLVQNEQANTRRGGRDAPRDA